MQAKRILILTNRIPYPLNDGGNLAMHAMIEGYKARGWQVYLLSMNTSRHYITPDVLKIIYTDLYAFETVAVNNDVRPLPTIFNYLFSRQPNHAVRFQHRQFAAKLQEVLETFSPHVVQFESVFLSGYLPLVRQQAKTLAVLRLHNIEYQVWQRLAQETKSQLKRLYLSSLAKRIEAYEKKVWRQYDLLLPITGADAGMVQAAGIDTPILTLPFGIEADNIPQDTHEQWALYHIGAMDWLPNEEAINWFLQDIWPEVHQQLPELDFYYAGRKMPVYFSHLHIPGAHCMGEVPNASAFIADKKILVVPLRSGGGIRVKILEAMAAGKVIISTTTGMQGIEAADGIHYLEANDAAAFIGKIKWVIANKEAAAVIGKASQTLVLEKYTALKLAEKLDNRLIDML